MPRLARADACFLPFPAAYFDAVVATFPAEYIAEEAAWISLQRVLNPQGRILVLLGAIPTGKGPWAWFSRTLFRLTGQAGKDEIIRLRTRFTEFFDRIGLQAELKIENKESSELMYLIVKTLSYGSNG